MIKNIVFDIGNVLADFSWEKSCRKLFADEDIYKRICDVTVRNKKKWVEFDIGNLTYEEVIKSFVDDEPELEEEIKLAVKTIFENIIPYDYSEGWVTGLKERGYKVYLLSNYGEKPAEMTFANFPFIDKVDGEIISYTVKLAKPDPKIYMALCDKYKLKPEECVFIDDMEENIEAAKACGFHGIVFKDKEYVDKRLSEILA